MLKSRKKEKMRKSKPVCHFPNQKIRRMGKKNAKAPLRIRVMAGLLAVATAGAPAISYASEAGRGLGMGSTTIGMEEYPDTLISTETGTDTTAGAENVLADTVIETRYLFLNLATAKYGKIIINEGKEEEQTIQLESIGTKDYICVYDKDGSLVSDYDAAANHYLHAVELQKDTVVSVKAIAEDGYQVENWEALTPDGESENSSILYEGVDAFSEPLLMDGNKTIAVSFAEKKELETEVPEPAMQETEPIATDTVTTEAAEPETNTESEAPDNLTVLPMEPGTENETESESLLLPDAEPETEQQPETTGETTPEQPDLSVNETEKETEKEAKTEPETEQTETISETTTVPETQETPAQEDLSVTETNRETETNGQEDLSVAEPETETDGETEPATEPVKEQETEAATEETTEVMAETETEPVSEQESELGTEGETEVSSEAQSETGEEHFLEENLAAGDLDGKDFSNARLIVMADDASVIVDPEHQVGNYENLYLLQYDSPEQAINAYLYYLAHAEAVEPDEDIQMAGEMETTTEPETGTWTEPVEGDNALTALNEEPDSPEAKAAVAEKVIALVDTGASNDSHLVSQVSLIDDTLAGNGHANEMLQAITSQNQDAKVLSIRVMDDSGKGTISSVVAGMEYAMQQQVSIINLSLYAKKSLRNAVLEAKIQEAVDKGITVVGAAGNDGADVENYIPGCVDSAYIIGAASEGGYRLNSSNYGDTVDYFVMAGSTSEAAALFSGYVSANGLDKLGEFSLLSQGLTPPTVTPDDSSVIVPTEEGTYDPIIESYVTTHADPAYTATDKMELVGLLPVKQTLADASVLHENSTIDTFNCTDELYAFAGQVEAFTAIYDLSNTSDYYVSYANTMLKDASAEAIDTAMAYNNNSGCDFEDYHYDASTGLVYIPKARFVIDGTYVIDAVQMQFLQKITFDDSFKVASTVTAVSDDSDKAYQTTEQEQIYDFVTNIKVEKNLDMDSLTVAINGCPVPSDAYTYNPLTGNLGIQMSSAAIQNVSLHSNGRKEGQAVSAAATTYSYASMPALNSKKNKLKGDFSAFEIGVTWRGSMDAQVHAENKKGDSLGVTGYRITGVQQKTTTSMLRYLMGRIGNASDIIDNDANGNLVATTPGTGMWTLDVASIVLDKKNVGFTAGTDAEDPCDWKSLLKSGQKRYPTRTYCSHITDPDRNYGGANDANNTGGIGKKEYNILKKYYSDVFAALPTKDSTYLRSRLIMRALQTGTDKDGTPWIVVGVMGQSIHHQNSTTIIKLYMEHVPKNEPTYVRIAKRMEGGGWSSALTQAEFTLYEGDTPLETIRIQDSGWQQFSTACTVGHTYRISETKVPDGMTAAPDETWTASKDEKMHQIWFYDGYQPYYVKVKKTSTAPADILALSGYSLAGAKFGVYADARCTQGIGTLTTDENGDTGVLTLPCTSDGTYTYYVKEETAPAGHSNAGQIKPFTIKLPDEMANKVRTVEFSDDPVFTQVDAFVQKVDMKGRPAKDVVFKVCLYDGEYATADACPGYALRKTWYLKSDGEGKVKMQNGYLANDYKPSDSFYLQNGQIVIPIGCTITYQEVKAPSKFIIDDTAQIWSKQGEQVYMRTFTNDLRPSKIKIKKLDSDGKTPLSNVTFELKFVKESSATTGAGVASKSYIPLLKQGETTQATTDAAGNIEWGNLDQGEYEVTEVKTVSSHTLLKDPIRVTLPITMTDQQAKAMSAATDQGLFDDTDGLWYFFEATYEVTNSANFTSPPPTGSSGVWIYSLAGFGLAALICGGLLVREDKRRKNQKRKE